MRTVCFGVCALILGLPAFAEGPDGDRPDKRERRPGGPGGFGEFIRNADKDGDGAVSRSEFGQLERISSLPEEKQDQLFQRLDKNGDGQIQKNEVGGPPNDRGKRPGIDFPKLDTDGNKSVSFEEFLKSPFVQRLPEERRRAFFDRLDQNGDGVLSPADHTRGKGRSPDGRGPRPGERGDRGDGGRGLSALDADGDGAVSFEEFRKSPWLKNLGEDAQEDRFEALDKDGNQKLEGDELKPKPPQERGERDGAPKRRPAPDGGGEA
ncbi:EF-hand domain-containing protein [Haloferula helveola]